MRNETIKLSPNSEATLTTYVLENERYSRKGVKKPAVIICPGGGYTDVSQNEGEPVALAFAHKGYHTFVLRYSVKIENPFPKQLLELAEAIGFVRENADTFGIIADQISVCGFSAGGHLTLSLGVYHDADFVTQTIKRSSEQIRPNALILGYPAVVLRKQYEKRTFAPEMIALMDSGKMMDFRGHDVCQIITGKEEYSEADLEPVNLLKQVGGNLPPVFIFGTMEDPVIPPGDLTDLARECSRCGVPCELHLFSKGPHGQGIYLPSSTEAVFLENNHMCDWFDQSIKWLGEMFPQK